MNPHDMADPQNIVRFILESNKYSKDKNIVKGGAFLPDPRRETSVMHIAGLDDNEIWEIGKKTVAEPRNKPLRARADVISTIIENEGLKIEHAPVEGNPYHANITGWPEEKAKQKIIAGAIARKANLLFPSEIN